MTIARSAIIAESADRMGRLITGSVAADPAPTDRIFGNAELLDSMKAFDLRGSSYLRMSSGAAVNEVRVIGSHDIQKGTISLTRPLSVAPTAADTFEIFVGVNPADLVKRCNEALPALYQLFDEAVDLTALADPEQDFIVKGTGFVLDTEIDYKKDIVEVYHERGTEPYKRRQLMWWTVLEKSADPQLTVRVYPVRTTGSLVFKVIRRYAALAADDDETECPDELIITSTIVRYWEFLRKPLAGGRLRSSDELPQIEKAYASALQDLAVAARDHLPVIIRRKQMTTPFILN